MPWRELLSALSGLAFLVGAPVLLAQEPWPATGMALSDAVMFLRAGTIPGELLVTVLTAVVVVSWGAFVFAVLADALRLLAGSGPRMAGLRLLAVLLTSGTAAATSGPGLATTSAATTGPSEQHEAKEEEAERIVRHRIVSGFATDSAELDSPMRESLASTARLIEEHGEADTEVTITGHTDPTGPEDHNQQLSENRASAAADYLRTALGESAQGVEITVRGDGSENARPDGATAHAELRRVECSYRLPVESTGERPAAEAEMQRTPWEGERAQQPEPVRSTDRLPASPGVIASAVVGTAAGYLLGRRAGRRSSKGAAPRGQETGPAIDHGAVQEAAFPLPGSPDDAALRAPKRPVERGMAADDLLAAARAGLSVTGPAAPAAIAALLARASEGGGPVIASEAALQTLPSGAPPTVTVLQEWEAALVRAEAHLLAVRRDAVSTSSLLVILDRPPSEGKQRLEALLDPDLPLRIIVDGPTAATGWHLHAAHSGLRLHGPDGQMREAELDALLTHGGSAAPATQHSQKPAGADNVPSEPQSPAAEEEPRSSDNPGQPRQSPSTTTPPADEGVRLRLFAPRVEIEIAGTDISSRMRSSARTLLALLATRDDGISADEAAEALAPGVDAARARAARNNAISSARRVIRDATGSEDEPVIINSNSRLYLEDSHLIHVDLWDFERACKRAVKTSDAGMARRIGDEIRAIYKSDLLGDIAEPWVEVERERCRRQVAQVYTDLARKTPKVDDKIEWLSHACSVDRYNESLHRALIEAQKKAGYSDAAHRVYQRLVEDLKEIGARPSREVRDAAASLPSRVPEMGSTQA